jgi:formyltetrahydrofolate-dependent phosphoribosylglycinamide formyltransferase
MSDSALRVGVLLSGTGRTLENFLLQRERGALPVEFACVLSSRAGVRGLEIAEKSGIPGCVVRRADYPSPDAYGEAIAAVLREHDVELAAMAGFLKLWHIPADYVDRVLNIHPALLPAFGGRGFHGEHVHRAVWNAGVKVSGCTVHFADNEYDHGPIVLQRAVALADDDDPERIAAKVFALECEAYPEAIRLFAASRLERRGRRVIVRPAC